MSETSKSQASRADPFLPPVPETGVAASQKAASSANAARHSPDFTEERIHVGRFRYRGELKHYAIVPGSMITSQTELFRLMRFWQLQTPDFIVETNTASTGSRDIITKENAPFMLKDIFFHKDDQITQPENGLSSPKVMPTPAAGSSNAGGDRTTGESESGSADQDIHVVEESHPQYWVERLLGKKAKLDDTDLDWINRYVQRKLSHALGSIVSAADMLNGWILCHGTPSLNERLLEAAIDTTGSSPTTLVVDNLNKYEGFLEHIFETGALKTMREVDVDQGEQTEIIDMDAFFAAKASHLPPTVLKRRSTVSFAAASPDDCVLWDVEDNIWTAKAPWMRGTHFIFSDRYESFKAGMLGQHGHICMHGHSSDRADPKKTGVIIREAVAAIKPCLLFDNTGAESQMYARLINEILCRDAEAFEKSASEGRLEMENKVPSFRLSRCWTELLHKCCSRAERRGRLNNQNIPVSTVERAQTHVVTKEFYEDLRLKLRQQAWELMEDANRGQILKSDAKDSTGTTGSVSLLSMDPEVNAESGPVLTIADVLQVVDLYCSNPRLFTKVVVPVDPLNDSPDYMVNKLMMSFARSNMEAREVGAGDADDKAVERAWRFHHQLDMTRRMKRSQRNLLYGLYIVAGFLTTVNAVVKEYAERYSYAEVVQEGLKWSTLGLAAVVSLCSGILGLLGADSQLAKIETAQAKIVCQLFQFRMRAGKYSLRSEMERDGTDMDLLSRPAKEGGLTGDPSSNRSTAMHRTRDRFSRQLKDISQELASQDLYYDRLAQGRMCANERRELENYVKEYLRNQNTKSSVYISGVMTSSDYYTARVCPLLERIENEEDHLRGMTRFLQVSSMFASTAAVILSSAGVISPIPAVIAGATGLFQFLRVNDYERRFEIASAAARELGALDSYWQSLSDLDRLRRSSVVKLVTTCEELALQFETSSVIQVDKSLLDPATGPKSRDNRSSFNLDRV